MLVSQMAPQRVRGPATLVTLGKSSGKTEEQVCRGRKRTLITRSVTWGAHQCRMRPARELYAHQRRQLCADLKTNKKIPVV